MYSELIKQLRERSAILFPHYGERRNYDADLMHEAADAIEELSAKVVLRIDCTYEKALCELVKQAEPPKEE